MPLLKHGMTGTPEHKAWLDMKYRCCNQKHPQFKDYGGRGIMICDDWMNDFISFFLDVGKRPTRFHSLDRFPNVNGHYEPGNVRWATRKMQQRNIRVVIRRWKGNPATLKERIAEFINKVK